MTIEQSNNNSQKGWLVGKIAISRSHVDLSVDNDRCISIIELA